MELRKVYEPVTILLVTSDLSPDIQKAADYAAIQNRKLLVFYCKRKTESTLTSRTKYFRNSTKTKNICKCGFMKTDIQMCFLR